MRPICGIGVKEINQSLASFLSRAAKRGAYLMIMMKDCAIQPQLALRSSIDADIDGAYLYSLTLHFPSIKKDFFFFNSHEFILTRTEIK